jgi:hypothetical protein
MQPQGQDSKAIMPAKPLWYLVQSPIRVWSFSSSVETVFWQINCFALSCLALDAAMLVPEIC